MKKVAWFFAVLAQGLGMLIGYIAAVIVVLWILPSIVVGFFWDAFRTGFEIGQSIFDIVDKRVFSKYNKRNDA